MKRFLSLPEVLLLAVMTAGLAACSGPDVQRPAQIWQGLHVVLETRPVEVSSGMNEFLVIVTGARGSAVNDLIVSLRIQGQDERWRQAIQDGHIGVYRKALKVNDPGNEQLQVRIKRDGKEGVLVFPLSLSSQPTNQ